MIHFTACVNLYVFLVSFSRILMFIGVGFAMYLSSLLMVIVPKPHSLLKMVRNVEEEISIILPIFMIITTSLVHQSIQFLVISNERGGVYIDPKYIFSELCLFLRRKLHVPSVGK